MLFWRGSCLEDHLDLDLVAGVKVVRAAARRGLEHNVVLAAGLAKGERVRVAVDGEVRVPGAVAGGVGARLYSRAYGGAREARGGLISVGKAESVWLRRTGRAELAHGA